jgi:hypothetical protein
MRYSKRNNLLQLGMVEGGVASLVMEVVPLLSLLPVETALSEEVFRLRCFLGSQPFASISLSPVLPTLEFCATGVEQVVIGRNLRTKSAAARRTAVRRFSASSLAARGAQIALHPS